MLLYRRTAKTIIQTYIIGSRSYYTKRKQRGKTPTLYGRISPIGNPNLNVTPELEKWVEMGKKVRFAELQRIIVDLRKRKRFNHALQVSEWTKNRGDYTFTAVQHAVQLDLIGKVHGLVSAESYFNGLSEEDKTDKTYGALLHCYVRQRQTEKALMHLKEMKEKGLPLSSVTFNDIMCLYSSNDEYDKVPVIFNQMKENGIQPDNLSYRICINSYGARSDVEGLEKVLTDMENAFHIVMDWNTYAVVANIYVKEGLDHKANVFLKKAEVMLDNKDGLGYNHLISLHARLGNKDDVFRLWDLEKNACKKCLNKDYIIMMEALVRLDELEEAEKLFKEWESSGNYYDFRVPNVVIVGCIEKGLCEKAEALLEHLKETGKLSTSNIWGRLAAGYLEKGDMKKGLESLKVAISLHEASKENKLDDKVITKILSFVGQNCNFDDTEKVLNLLRLGVQLKRQMYHALLKSYIICGKEVDRLLDTMKADNFEEDEETLKILALKHNEM